MQRDVCLIIIICKCLITRSTIIMSNFRLLEVVDHYTVIQISVLTSLLGNSLDLRNIVVSLSTNCFTFIITAMYSKVSYSSILLLYVFFHG